MSSDARHVASRASVSYSGEVEEHTLVTAPRIELVNFPLMPTAGP